MIVLPIRSIPMRIREIRDPYPYTVEIKIDPIHFAALERWAAEDETFRIKQVVRAADLWTIIIACASVSVRDAMRDRYD